MTPRDAAALALAGIRHRRFLSVLVRVLTGKATVEDRECVPERARDESVAHWTARCRQPDAPPHVWQAAARDLLTRADAQLRDAERKGIHPLPIGDPAYPALLATIPDPPPMLWVRGDATVLQRLAVALVGSRAASGHGLEMARVLASDLALTGVVVVSGLARGVDSAAHQATLDRGGRTVAVLGSGVDRVYPAEHRDLAAAIAATGAVISEFPPGIAPLPYHFPLRNRIISGLSSAVVVVEAAEKSGALITAAAALEQGRELLAVPGPVPGGRNRGAHLLLRDGAKPVESAVDILQETATLAAVRPPAASAMPAETIEFTVDDVAAETGLAPNLVLARLLELELAGTIQRIGGGRFRRNGRQP